MISFAGHGSPTNHRAERSRISDGKKCDTIVTPIRMSHSMREAAKALSCSTEKPWLAEPIISKASEALSARKKYPEHNNKHHSRKPAGEVHQAVVGNFRQHRCRGLVRGKSRSVHTSPKHKFPCRAVPQTAYKHCRHKIDIGSDFALAVATERYVYIVSEPRAERNMPAVPEVTYIASLVREVEIQGESETHDERKTYSHVGVARKVAVNLHSIAHNAHKRLKPV